MNEKKIVDMQTRKEASGIFLEKLQQRVDGGKSSIPAQTSPFQDEDESSTELVREVELSTIELSPFQTREIDSAEDLEELKASILARGVLQPIILRETEPGAYELVAGERRFRAAELAGLNTIPAIVRDLGDRDSLEVSIIENAQRENLNPIEEARAFQLLAEKFKASHAEIARAVGKNRATISNSLRLLQLEPEVIELLRSAELSAGHGRALLMVEEPEQQLKLARLAVRKALSVRALERLVSGAVQFEEETEELDEKGLQTIKRLEEKISSFLGIDKVKLRLDRDGHKRLVLNFDSEAAWKRFLGKVRE